MRKLQSIQHSHPESRQPDSPPTSSPPRSVPPDILAQGQPQSIFMTKLRFQFVNLPYSYPAKSTPTCIDLYASPSIRKDG
jgi:hypothetical protein